DRATAREPGDDGVRGRSPRGSVATVTRSPRGRAKSTERPPGSRATMGSGGAAPVEASRRSRGSSIAADVALAAVDGADETGGHLVGGAEPVDGDEEILRQVPRDQRRRLLVVEVEALAHGVRRVVLALHDLATAHVAGPVVP